MSQGACVGWGLCGRGHAWQGACIVGDMHGGGKHGRGVHGGGGGTCEAGETAADGTHPTGMLSC